MTTNGATYTLHFTNELDFLHYASVILGASYTSGKDAMDAINRSVRGHTKLHGDVGADLRESA